MNRGIIKPIVGGIVLGAALFFIPFFLLRVVAFVIIVGAIFRLFAGRRRFGRGFNEHRLAFADNIRNMSDEEYQKFKSEMPYGCGPRSRQHSETKIN